MYDGAAKSHGVSLNDHVLQGPVFANDLGGVPIRFSQDLVSSRAIHVEAAHSMSAASSHQASTV